MSEFKLPSFDEALANTRSPLWVEGEEIHRVAKCSCDKCGLIRAKRVEHRKSYIASYNNNPVNKERHKLYQKHLRKLGKQKTGVACIQLAWAGSPFNDKHHEFYKSVKAFCEANSLSVNEMVFLAVTKFMKGKKS